MSRQQHRRNRLLEQEMEQRLEDAEGLVMTEEQRQLLLSPFMSVKCEFHDLDGLRWTQTALHKRQYNRRPSIAPHPVPYRQPTLQGKTPDSFLDMDETIRGYAPSKTHTSPTLKKRNKFRSPITESFWDPDIDTDTLMLSFPRPPSTIPVPPRKATFTAFDGLGLIVAPNGRAREPLLPLSFLHSEDESFYDQVMEATRCFNTTTFQHSYS
ncbi:hypothetical protein Agabi119p4_1405 [Agaricus bisporus var. burnettii]|uniref:Uncharacterized protein n=1 Tax=Agaricus bisporus var. burnettii TaxID=192524 RepID=A0A8H7F9Q4_AGABI|nr:hypothetical protein AGABI2DRAFT_123396 [Agaricus bisporus var. bisporus H97]EKV41924.1 hypothetical protein AGABI2DRAFT_123396 [Agaricus bisporus var. bisporus H97]KAF7783381.1 hypothetical protein Agabi119p4_1405 [Agaricus bisporus var. burnettii]